MSHLANKIDDVIQTSFTIKEGRFVSKVTASDSFIGIIEEYIPNYEKETLTIRKTVKRASEIVEQKEKTLQFECGPVTIIGSKPSQVEAYCRELHESNPTNKQKMCERKFLKARRP